jgi:putative ATPase
MSAAVSGVGDIKKIIERAKADKRLGTNTIVFVDEIHRFNKLQQDSLLPHIENGTITFIGATTENPSFEVNSALLSRARVFVLELLDADEIERLIRRALSDKKEGLGEMKIKISDDTIKYLAQMADGDARCALNALELAANTAKESSRMFIIGNDLIRDSLQRTHLLYDRAGEEHYNIISALHKSMRGSDADASLYWLGRMLEGGEDPLYVARRIIRFASEDIGIANSLALPQAVAAYQACHFIGMPECAVNLAQAVVYMAKSKKSNALYTAYTQVQEDIKDLPNEPVPLYLRNAPTKLMKKLGYGKNYKYTPNYRTKDAKQDYLPEKLRNKKYLK